MSALILTSAQRSALARVDQPLASARTPPGWLYGSEDVHGFDIGQLFTQQWLCCGHVSRLREPGAYFLVDIGATSVIVVNGRDNVPRAFHNVCRHRGTRLLDDCEGSIRSIRCPYHAWHYALDGSLLAAPSMGDAADFRREDYPLNSVQLGVFNGFLFLNIDPGAQPLAEHFADFPDLSRFRLESLVTVARHEYDVAANWKLVCENYNECYHCSLAHPQLHRISADLDQPLPGHAGRHFTGGPMRLREGFNAMIEGGQSEQPRLPGASAEDGRLVYYFHLFPTLLLSIAPHYVLTHTIWPRGPQACRVETEWLCAPEQLTLPDFDMSGAVAFWDQTNRQDWALCENAMRGLGSAGHLPGPYQAGERCVHDFDRWYVRRITGQED